MEIFTSTETIVSSFPDQYLSASYLCLEEPQFSSFNFQIKQKDFFFIFFSLMTTTEVPNAFE